MAIRLSNSDKLSIISNLSTMLSAGIPILEAVDSLLEEVKGNQEKILNKLKEDLNQGKTISSCFARFPEAFDPVTINLIKAAEDAGTLDTTLKDLTITIKKDMEFNEKVKTAMTYPVLVMAVFSGILLLILTFVIPKIATVFSRLRVELPLPTKILIAISNALLSYTWYFVIGFIFLVIISVVLFKVKRKWFINFIFSLPLLSGLAREIDFTRFSRSMSLLLASGIPITEALALAENVVYKQEVAKVIKKALETVSAGKNISESFRDNKNIVPGVMLRITEAGEKSGTLEKSMQEIADFFDNRVSDNLKRLTTLLEPVLLIIVGILVGGMMLAIIAPIYGLIGQIQTR